MSRYSNIDFVLDMYYQDGAMVVNTAREHMEEEKQWLRYCASYPHMQEPRPTFEKFYNPPKQRTKTRKTKAEVIDLAERIREADQAKRQVI